MYKKIIIAISPFSSVLMFVQIWCGVNVLIFKACIATPQTFDLFFNGIKGSTDFGFLLLNCIFSLWDPCCFAGSGSGFRIRIRIHWPDWIWIQMSRIRIQLGSGSRDPDPDPNPDPQPCGLLFIFEKWCNCLPSKSNMRTLILLHSTVLFWFKGNV